MNDFLKKIGEFYIINLPQNAFSKENIENLKDFIDEIIDQGALNILFNMTNIEKIDGIGLGTLLNFQKIALFNEVSIRLYGLQPYVVHMLFQTRLNKVMDICQIEDESLFDETLIDDILCLIDFFYVSLLCYSYVSC